MQPDKLTTKVVHDRWIFFQSSGIAFPILFYLSHAV